MCAFVCWYRFLCAARCFMKMPIFFYSGYLPTCSLKTETYPVSDTYGYKRCDRVKYTTAVSYIFKRFLAISTRNNSAHMLTSAKSLSLLATVAVGWLHCATCKSKNISSRITWTVRTRQLNTVFQMFYQTWKLFHSLTLSMYRDIFLISLEFNESSFSQL